MTRWLLALPLLVAVTLTPSASAGPRINPANAWGVGAGVYIGPDGTGTYGSSFGIFPTYYPGFYGNGYSAYGPPVPTYSSIPGVFGGADQRLGHFPPFFGWGTGWFGYRSPSPRPVPNFDYIAPGHFLPEPQPVIAAAQEPCFKLEVRVPESAKVFVNGTETKQGGAVRSFASPPLKAEEVYTYEVRAEWDEGARPRSETRSVTGRPGSPYVVDFSK